MFLGLETTFALVRGAKQKKKDVFSCKVLCGFLLSYEHVDKGSDRVINQATFCLTYFYHVLFSCMRHE